jgi:hypothetical protein
MFREASSSSLVRLFEQQVIMDAPNPWFRSG